MGAVVGIDVGGTFTDLYYASDDGAHSILKVPSTPHDPSVGLLNALEACGAPPDSLDAILHGTTIATNAVIEKRGAACALITTRGFRDVLELGRRDRPTMYGLTGSHTPLIPRDRRYEVDERLDYQGNVLTPLDEAQVRAIAESLKEAKIEAVVISFMHAYANTAHEDRARTIVASVDPAWEVVTATSVVREYYEFERTSTGVVQGYLQPLVARYARNLTQKLADWGFRRDVLVMQSNGGLAPLAELDRRAAFIVRSGPAAGVTAAADLAATAGFANVITADMGGTSFDVAVVIAGEPNVAEITNLDFRIPLRLPMIDVHTIGAGGGSIASLDRGGVLQVGPRSAGAVPGPVAYRRGGVEPTVTDANVVLGRIDPQSQMGGPGTSLDVEGAKEAVADLGKKLGLGVEETAEAIIAIVDQRMAGRIRLLSIERGLDPRDFALVAFGGAGPLHCNALMREVGIGAMLVPQYPGVLCAMGCAIADVRYDFSQTLEQRLDGLEPAAMAAILEKQREQGRKRLEANGLKVGEVKLAHVADMSYAGQIHSMRVPIGLGWSREKMSEAFLKAYEQEFGNSLGDIPLMVVNLRTVATGSRRVDVGSDATETATGAPTPRSRRPVHMGRWRDTPIYHRDDLKPGHVFEGPVVVEQKDTTTLIEPGMNVRIDARGNMIVGAK
ncbi:MAG: hydantoinase/oxoprolinase family protein [Beijerinckiaceae bacterium]